MRLATIKGENGRPHLAVDVTKRGGERVLDVTAAAAAQDGAPVPSSVGEVIEMGAAGPETVRRTVDWAMSRGDEAWFPDPEAVVWSIPFRPDKVICGGRNFRAHRDEGVRGGDIAPEPDLPTGFIKLSSVLVPHRSAVARPRDVAAFDYEVEMVAIAGRPLLDASYKEAEAAIFGYAIMIDLSAREWQMREIKEKLLVLGKNFPGFGPIGPWVVTRDEIGDIGAVELSLTVNGEERQRGSCSEMIFDYPSLIAHWSRMGLAAGDMVSGGTPAGVAFRRPDPAAFYLKPGDTVVAASTITGALSISIAADPEA